jgi:hypothetical protein
MQPKITIGSFNFLPAAIEVQGTPRLAEWEQPLLFALWCQRASPWWIGDLLNAGEASFGEEFSQVCRGHVSGDQLQRYESVARRVPVENRNPNLSWSSHAMVARLPSDQQRAALKLAEQQGWTSQQLRAHVRQLTSRRGPS